MSTDARDSFANGLDGISERLPLILCMTGIYGKCDESIHHLPS